MGTRRGVQQTIGGENENVSKQSDKTQGAITQIPSDDKHGRSVAYMDYMKQAMEGLGYGVKVRMADSGQMQIELADKNGEVFLANRFIREINGAYHADLSEAVGLRTKEKNGKRIATALGAYQPFIRAELRALENIVKTASSSLLGHGSVVGWQAEFPRELKDLERGNTLELTFDGQKPAIATKGEFDTITKEVEDEKPNWNYAKPEISFADIDSIRDEAWGVSRPVKVGGGRTAAVNRPNGNVIGGKPSDGTAAAESQRIETQRVLGETSDEDIDDAIRFSQPETITVDGVQQTIGGENVKNISEQSDWLAGITGVFRQGLRSISRATAGLQGTRYYKAEAEDRFSRGEKMKTYPSKVIGLPESQESLDKAYNQYLGLQRASKERGTTKLNPSESIKNNK